VLFAAVHESGSGMKRRIAATRQLRRNQTEADMDRRAARSSGALLTLSSPGPDTPVATQQVPDGEII